MLNPYANRKYVIGMIVVGVSLAFVARLFYLQVIDEDLKIAAANNSQRVVTQYPSRGLIFDRDERLLVDNEAAYDLMVIPKEVLPFDTAQFCQILEVTREFVDVELAKARAYSSYKPSVFMKQISSEKYAIFQEVLYKFSGFYVQTRTLRKYPLPIAAHVLGYVGEVNQAMIDQDSYYKSGDYIGISGIEKSYERALRGIKGVSYYLVDVHNRIKESYADGRYDTMAVVGSHVVTTLDAELQTYGELLMANKRGSIVAIEPATGEILALVSSPSYDPNLLVGRVRSKNYQMLSQDSLTPLFNRALMAKYPPGSTFKLVNALIGLEEGVITTESSFTCSGGYVVGNFRMGCHHSGAINFLMSIQGSCNAYYANVFRRILDNRKYGSVSLGYANWRRHVLSFGLGQRLGSDLTAELEGFVPKVDYFDRYYGEGRWRSLMLVSMSIGQGELGVTPFQMANMTAIIANRGFYCIPHIVKDIMGPQEIDPRFLARHYTTVSPEHFEPVVDGMELVVLAGTGTSARTPGISVCGKTGTAENPHGEDHSIFVAFAPKHDPRIALSVYVENGGFGATWAGPIASLMIERYLTDTIARPALQERILGANLLAD